MIFDTHAHYDDEAFDEDRDEVLTSLRKRGVGTVVNVGASMEGSRRSVSLSEEYEFVYSAVGVHPDEVGELREEDMEWMREQLQKPKVVAVGEIGLDYYWDKEGHDLQKKWFLRQLKLAKELKKPVIIHSREAAADTMELLKANYHGLLFLFARDGKRIPEDGTLSGNWRRADLQECEEAEGDGTGVAYGISASGDRLPVSGTGA